MKNLILTVIVFISFKCVAQVTSVTGTANQVIASGSTGAITLSLPQSIATTSSPKFGRLVLGGITPTSTSFLNIAPITGNTSAYANNTVGTIQSDVTGAAIGYESSIGTQAASFTLPALYHFRAVGGTIGTGSVITNQYGYIAGNNLTGGTNNYGFTGEIPSGTGRWNLYMSGTASNYLAGNLGIGTTTPAEKLSVNGNIRAKEVKVETANWPDYVFHKTYALKPLQEVEKFIQANQHLPGIPSALEVEKDGLNLGEMDARLLQKIEELTLYMIEKDKQVKEQNARITTLERALLQLTANK